MGTKQHLSADVAGSEEQASVKELIDAVRGRARRLDSLEAAHELGRRRPQRWAQVLGEVVRKKDRPENLRVAAAVELGRKKARANETALLAALDPSEPAVTRRAAEGLGRIGNAAAMERLTALPSLRGRAGESVDFACKLIAYRLGLDAPRLRRPPARQVVEVTAEHAVRISTDPVPTPEAEALVEQLHPEVPAISLSPTGAVQLHCGQDARFLVLVAEQAQRGQALEELTKHSGVLGAVFEWWETIERYALSEYLLTHPETNSRLRLFGVRPTGTVVHTGEILVEDTTATFTVRGLDRPHSVAVAIDGTIDRSTGTATFTEALADPAAPARRPPDLRLTDLAD